MLQDISGSTVAFGRMGIGAAIILVYLMVSGNLTSVLGWTAGAWGWVLVTSVFLLGYVWTFYNGLKLVREEARPISASPGRTRLPSRISLFSTTPTQKPARS